MVLVPHLQTLAQPLRRRVFIQRSVPQILQQLLDENALLPDSYRIEMSVGQYPQRPFCIQYEESDLALLQRLCEEEGIHYHFEHQADGHVVVLADDSLNLPQVPTLIPFKVDEHTPSPSISTLYQHHHAAPIATLPAIRNRGQRTFQEDAANQTAPHPAPPVITAIEQHHALQRSRRQLERQRCQHRSIQGRSDGKGLLSGHLLQVTDHPISYFNEQWLITEMRHQGQHPSILDPVPTVHRYYNDFTAQPWSTDFRPPLKQPRPRIGGYHLAQVLGCPGQPSSLDEQGRIAVRLWPGQQPPTVETEAIWLPVAMARASGRIAPDELPCAGSEVWVSFLDSDPDRPILCLGTPQQRQPRDTSHAPDNGLLLDWLVNRAGH
jgi:type VI secretion system secreted protein VgrG